jgi:hypothetical protein
MLKRMRERCYGSLVFKAWQRCARVLISAKTLPLKRARRNCVSILSAWNALVLWHMRIDAALAQAVSDDTHPLSYDFKDMKSEISAVAASVASVLIHRPLTWPRVSSIRNAIMLQYFAFSRLSRSAVFFCHMSSTTVGQTLRALSRNALASCLLSEVFHSWKRARCSRAAPAISDGDICDVIGAACIAAGSLQPQLLGFCALKVTAWCEIAMMPRDHTEAIDIFERSYSIVQSIVHLNESDERHRLEAASE